ncbi:hypothetical protein [Frankia tisae]|uniref:hypothetical protein n=1 Tax=Frankia tisae TaxID=2950104 RepID=UPI0021BE5ADF|nr:hypothetical protein [Frankia tisae]
MPASPFEKFLPWTGGLAGILWGVQLIASKTPDHPARPTAVTLVDHAAGRNYVAGFALLLGALMLLFFAAQARTSLRSGEAGESTYSSVAHGGLLIAAAGFSLLGISQIALVNAAKAHDAAATDALGQLTMIGWLPALVGLVAAFWGLGLGGLRTATLPKWFAIGTIVLGVVGVLGPLAFAVYLLLPLWLIVASIVTARRSTTTTSPSTARVPAEAH